MTIRQRCWWVYLPGRPPFAMVHMGPMLDKGEALKIARCKWPNCNIRQSDVMQAPENKQ